MPVPTAPAVLTELRTLAAYSEGAGIYRIVPREVARPEGMAELLALVEHARETGLSLTPWGAGTGMAGGNVGDGILVDLGHLDLAAVRVEVHSQSAVTAAGATFAALGRVAEPRGLRLPVSPSSWKWATLGGAVSTNASGARSFRYGSVRRWVQGLTLVTSDGETVDLVRGGPSPTSSAAVRRFQSDVEPVLRAAGDRILARFPKTRKNSFGYALDAWLRTGDLLDLVIGAEGTLGLVTAVRWRLDRIPEARAGLRLAVPDDRALGAALETLLASPASAVELLDRTFLEFVAGVLPEEDRAVAARSAAMLLVEFEGGADGPPAEVEHWSRRLAPWTLDLRSAFGEQGLERLWEIRHAASPLLTRLTDGRRSLQVIEDGCVPPERLPEYLTALREIPARYGIAVTLFGHAGDGHVHVNLLPDVTVPGWERTVSAIFESVSEVQLALGGTPSGEHGAGRLRSGLMERCYGPEITGYFRLVKAAFDPLGIMNPGVIVPAPEGGTGGPITRLKVGAGATEIPPDIAGALRAVEQDGRWDRDRLELAAAG